MEWCFLRLCRSFLPAASVALGAIAFLATVPASATTYTTYITSADNQGNILNFGLTSGGSVVLENLSGFTYTEFTPPSTITSFGTTSPSLICSNGSACAATGTGAYSNVSGAVCNGLQEVFVASLDGGADFGLFSGPDPVANLVYAPGHYGFDKILLNAAGDVAAVVTGGAPTLGDRNVLVIASTPEPSSLMLLGTGFVGVIAAGRRRLRV